MQSLAAPMLSAGYIGPFDYAQGRLFAAKNVAQDDNAFRIGPPDATTSSTDPPRR